MLKVDMSPRQARAVVALIQGSFSTAEKMPSYDALEELVLACRALRMAEELPKGVSAPPDAGDGRRGEGRETLCVSGVGRSGAAEAAELKRATLARLETYRKTGGLVSLTPLAQACKPVDGKAISAEMLARMLNRERFPVAIWRAVAAALDKMDRRDVGEGDVDENK